MALTDQIIENPVMGDRVKFLVTSADSGGKLLKVELWCKPGAKGSPRHYHPLQTETFEVIRGELGLEDEGKKRVLKAGERYTVLPGSPHRFYNASTSQDLLVEVDVQPALKTEFFFETMYSLAKEGKTNGESLPKNLLQFSALLHEYYGEMFAVGPPVLLQKIIAKGLGGFAKLLGYKGFIPFRNN